MKRIMPTIPNTPEREKNGADSVIESWEAIGHCVNTVGRNAQRLHQKKGLPVHRDPDNPHHVYALRSELDAWKALPIHERKPGCIIPATDDKANGTQPQSEQYESLATEHFERKGRCWQRLCPPSPYSFLARHWRGTLTSSLLSVVVVVGVVQPGYFVPNTGLRSRSDRILPTPARLVPVTVPVVMVRTGEPFKFAVIVSPDRRDATYSRQIRDVLVNAVRQYGAMAAEFATSVSPEDAPDTALREAAAAGVHAVVWTDTNTAVAGGSLHYRVLDPRASLPFLKEAYPLGITLDKTVPVGPLEHQLRFLAVLTMGLGFYEQSRYADAIVAFRDVLSETEQYPTEKFPLDPDIARFYHALAQQSFVDTAGDRTGDPDGIVARLDFVIDDLKRVLQHHAAHAGASFNLALAYQNRGDILKQQGKLREAAEAYDRATQNFTSALTPGRIEPQFLKHEPNHANVVWNLAVTNALLSDAWESMNQLAIALRPINDSVDGFHRLLAENQYAKFVASKPAEIHLNCGYAHEARYRVLNKFQKGDHGGADRAAAKQQFRAALREGPSAKIKLQATTALNRL